MQLGLTVSLAPPPFLVPCLSNCTVQIKLIFFLASSVMSDYFMKCASSFAGHSFSSPCAAEVTVELALVQPLFPEWSQSDKAHYALLSSWRLRATVRM